MVGLEAHAGGMCLKNMAMKGDDGVARLLL